MIRLLRHEPAALALLAAFVLFFVLLVLVAGAFLLAHHRFSVRRERRLKTDIASAAAFLAPRLFDGPRAARAIAQARDTWGARPVVTVLRRIRQGVRGQIAETVSRALEEMGTVGALTRAARGRGWARRARALRLLGQCGGDQAREVLVAALDDPEPRIRQAAREALPAIRDGRSLRAAMISYLRDAEQRTAWRAGFFSNVAAHTPDALRAMVAVGALAASDEKLALEALAEVGDLKALPLAEARLEVDSAELRATAARAVGKLGGRRAVVLLVPRLADPEWIVRAAAARALESSRCGALACWALGDCLTDPVWWVRANAARTLARQGELGALALAEASESGDRFARESALAALASLRTARASVAASRSVPALEESQPTWTLAAEGAA